MRVDTAGAGGLAFSGAVDYSAAGAGSSGAGFSGGLSSGAGLLSSGAFAQAIDAADRFL